MSSCLGSISIIMKVEFNISLENIVNEEKSLDFFLEDHDVINIIKYNCYENISATIAIYVIPTMCKRWPNKNKTHQLKIPSRQFKATSSTNSNSTISHFISNQTIPILSHLWSLPASMVSESPSLLNFPHVSAGNLPHYTVALTSTPNLKWVSIIISTPLQLSQYAEHHLCLFFSGTTNQILLILLAIFKGQKTHSLVLKQWIWTVLFWTIWLILISMCNGSLFETLLDSKLWNFNILKKTMPPYSLGSVVLRIHFGAITIGSILSNDPSPSPRGLQSKQVDQQPWFFGWLSY